MRAVISRTVSSILTGRTLRSLRRAAASAPRRLGAKATVRFFHQPDDPWSRLAFQMLDPLQRVYRVKVETHIVSRPDAAAAPEYERLAALGLRDAALLARAYGLENPVGGAAPPGPTAAGDALRKRLGHYLSAMFWFEGEWFWGIDRLHYLEERLREAGLAVNPGSKLLAPVREVTLSGPRGAAKGTKLDFFLSFRSPYTWLAVPRVRRLAEHYGADLRLRFVLPMVMRGLPVPSEKRFYILRDTKREADRLGMRFGAIVDPVGKPAERGLAVLHHAIAAGKGPEFAESYLGGVFADGIDAGTGAGLNRIAARAGLDEAFVNRALGDESWRQTAEANRQDLFGLGLWGVPSFRVGAKPAHWGQDRLWAVEEELQQMT